MVMLRYGKFSVRGEGEPVVRSWWQKVALLPVGVLVVGAAACSGGGADDGASSKRRARVMVAVSGDQSYGTWGPADRSGGVWSSADGSTWQRRASLPASLYGVAASRDRAVAVGTDRAGRGVVYGSGDGLRWKRAARLPVPLADVALGTGGTWLAVGSDGGTKGRVPVYRSTNGRSWKEISVYESYRVGLRPLALAHGGGRWLMLVWDCAGARFCGVRPLASVDQGRSWQPTADDPGPQRTLDGDVPFGLSAMSGPLGLAHDGKRWAALGPQRAGRKPAPSKSAGAGGGGGTGAGGRGQVSGSPTGHVWTDMKWSPGRPALTAATFSRGTWFAAAGPVDADTGAQEARGASRDGASVQVWSSRDLRRWTPAATVAAPVRDLAVFDPEVAPPGTGRPAGAGADTALRIDADAVRTVPSKGGTVRAFTYGRSPGAFTKWLTNHWGPPTDRRMVAGDDICSLDETVLRWNGLSVMFPGVDPVTATSFHVTHGLDWAVENDLRRVNGAQGIGLGAARTEVDRVAPGAASLEYEDTLTVLLTEAEPGSGEGVVAELTRERVTALHAPASLEDTC
ncbi:hypothetical protein [Streptomyces sp. NPDC094466]|uniref:hypothetical protein n=1 Tax=Streptomyces sp. NPDC094466 TaxID=3366065 RepID=UPI003823EF65